MGNLHHGTTYMRVGGNDGELRPWHYIYAYRIESRKILRVRYDGRGSDQEEKSQYLHWRLPLPHQQEEAPSRGDNFCLRDRSGFSMHLQR